MRKTQFLQFLQFCTVRTAEQCTQQRTAAAIDTAVGSRGRAQRAGCVLCAQALCASMRSARSACLLAARTARCFYHAGLPLAPSSCPSSPSRSRQALPALASLLARAQMLSRRRLHAKAPAMLHCKALPTSNSTNAVAPAPRALRSTHKAKAHSAQAQGSAGQSAQHRQPPACTSTGQCRAQAGSAAYRLQCRE